MNSIKLWWKYEGRYYYRNFIIGIKNLYKWFSVIWKDRDWDDYFIYELLKHKLQNQANYTLKRKFYVGFERDAQLMKLCCKLINIIQDETYLMEYMDYRKETISFVDVKDKPGWKEMIVETKSENLNDYFNKYPLIYKKVIREYPKFCTSKLTIAIQIAIVNQKRCKDLLFNIINNRIDGWWD
jgi:predicted transport protein